MRNHQTMKNIIIWNENIWYVLEWIKQNFHIHTQAIRLLTYIYVRKKYRMNDFLLFRFSVNYASGSNMSFISCIFRYMLMLKANELLKKKETNRQKQLFINYFTWIWIYAGCCLTCVYMLVNVFIIRNKCGGGYWKLSEIGFNIVWFQKSSRNWCGLWRWWWSSSHLIFISEQTSSVTTTIAALVNCLCWCGIESQYSMYALGIWYMYVCRNKYNIREMWYSGIISLESPSLE